MTVDAPDRRSTRRVLAEVTALGGLVAFAVVCSQGGLVTRDSANSASTAPIVSQDAEPPSTADVALPTEPEAWKRMSHDDLEAVGRRVAEITPGFRFKRVEVFSGAGLSKAIVVLVHEKTELEFCLIPPGSFLMGSPERESGADRTERPLHRVTFERAFLIGRTECTQAAWRLAGGARVSNHEGPLLPVEQVSWNDVAAWCVRAGLRLPTEAEWEYTCRAGTTTRFWSGNARSDLDLVAWIGDNAESTNTVAAKPANPFGLYDVHGNVHEWCQDTVHDSYDGAPVDGSAWVDEPAEERIHRGGSFFNTARAARSADRSWAAADGRYIEIGFRAAASVGSD